MTKLLSTHLSKCRLHISLSPASGMCQIPNVTSITNFVSSSVRWFGQPAAQTHPHLLSDGEVTPGITKDEYKSRRSLLMSLAQKKSKALSLVKEHMLVFPSASKVFMTNDIPYPFRQNTEFLYLSGFQEPDSVLIIQSVAMNNSSTTYVDNHRSFLFVPKKDPVKELWDGPRSGTEGALFLTGVDFSYNIDELEKFLAQYCRNHNSFMLWYDFNNSTLSNVHKRIMSDLICQERHKGIDSTTNLMHHLRVIKSKSEVTLMKQTVEIASDALAEVMRFSKPQVNESHLWAKMDFECRLHGAQFLAYPPVVAGGVRANIIHYIANNQVINDGELVLMDAGCEFHGYTSDLTRTWPVSGKFSPSQRELYNAVLAVQMMCISLCTPTNSLDDVYRQMLVLLGIELQTLGIIPNGTAVADIIKRARELCPHHVGHYLGMDVHDTAEVPRSIKLQSGMIVTIEPGIYIPVDDMNAPEKYRGIGIRIEDNILITDSKPINLSEKCPKTVEDIERVMATH